LIWISSELTRYSLVTPNRPEATCLIALRRLSPLASATNRASLPPLAGVAPAAEPVHGDGQRLVRLAADRAVRHRAGGEPLDDRLDRLDLLDRGSAALVELEAEEAAERAEPLALLVDRLGVLLEDVDSGPSGSRAGAGRPSRG
jgi:hypothetical protein